jgi:hypothetical protein
MLAKETALQNCGPALVSGTLLTVRRTWFTENCRFDDCLRLGKKISEEPYLFPDPEIFALEHDGPPAPRNNEDLRSALTPVPHTVQSSLAAPREATIFRKRVIRLSNDLKVGSRTRGALEDIIRNGGGGIVDCVAGADIYVGQYRDGPEFVQAYEDGLDIGNLSWLYYLIAHNKWTNPMRRLLHYPVPLKGIPGFEAYNISISNYTGDARVYLESLIKACGAQFTKTMKQDNTHLITGHTSGEKCEAALEWNIHMVNHLWLEDSYAQYNEQSITIKRYTHFPLRTNLGEVMGQTPIDRIALEENFLPMPKKHVRHLSDAKIDHVPQSSVVPQEKKAVYTSKALQNTSHLGEDVPPVDRKEKLSINDTFATPSRNAAGGKENETPLTTGSRASKTAALSKLHDNALDIALYDKERKRVGGVTHGRDRRSGVDELMDGSRSDGESRKRKSADSDEDTDDDDDDETAGIEARPGKKAKTEKKPAIKHRMLLTMYDRWTKSPKVQQEDKVSATLITVS